MKPLERQLAVILLALPPAAGIAAETIGSIEALGRALYFDVNLSKNRSQSCSATCHSPDFGFTDPRGNASGKAVSPVTMDIRWAIAMHRPRLIRRSGGLPPRRYGTVCRRRPVSRRARKDLAGQAGGPPLSRIEMGMRTRPAWSVG